MEVIAETRAPHKPPAPMSSVRSVQEDATAAHRGRSLADKLAGVQLGEPSRFGPSVKPVPDEVKALVEALYEKFQEDPDYWWPVQLDSEEETDETLALMRKYVTERPRGRLVVNVRRMDEPGLAFYRVSGYKKRSKS